MQKSLTLNNLTLDWGTRTYIMGILNVTPDSFSGDGLIQDEDVVEAAINQAQRFIEAGADILDVGGKVLVPARRRFLLGKNWGALSPWWRD